MRLKKMILPLLLMFLLAGCDHLSPKPFDELFVYVYFVGDGNSLVYESTIMTEQNRMMMTGGKYGGLYFNDNHSPGGPFAADNPATVYSWTDKYGARNQRAITPGEQLIITRHKREFTDSPK